MLPSAPLLARPSELPRAALLARPSALPRAPLLDAPLAVQYAVRVRPDLRQKRQRRALPSALPWAALAAVRPAVAEGPCLGRLFSGGGFACALVTAPRAAIATPVRARGTGRAGSSARKAAAAAVRRRMRMGSVETAMAGLAR